MAQPSIYKDKDARLAGKVLGFDFQHSTDAIWCRYDTATDLYCHFNKALLPHSTAELFLLTEVLPSTKHSKISEFQGAFGRENMLGTNKIRTFRQKITKQATDIFLDAAPLDCAEEFPAYFKAVYNSASGFILGEKLGSCSGIAEALRKKTLDGFIVSLIDHHKFIGLFTEDNFGARSIVYIGNSLINTSRLSEQSQHKSNDELLERISTYGERLANRRVVERAIL